jgi:hypothetical protein
LGFVWEVLATWESRYAALVEYKRKHGNCRVPTKSKDDASLGNWVSMMRLRRSQGRLSAERIRLLDQLGFVWNRAFEAQSGVAWESKYAELVEYQRMHGHCRVSTLSEDHANLGNWVSGMRRYRKQGKLNEERIRRLDKIGFVWTRTEEAWESKYAELVEYKRTHGHCRVPQSHSRLGRWVNTVRGYRRRAKLSEERVRRLDLLGFTWDMPPGPHPRD